MAGIRDDGVNGAEAQPQHETMSRRFIGGRLSARFVVLDLPLQKVTPLSSGPLANMADHNRDRQRI